jgi:hypothetical protein
MLALNSNPSTVKTKQNKQTKKLVAMQLPQRTYTDDQQAHEKMFNIIRNTVKSTMRYHFMPP